MQGSELEACMPEGWTRMTAVPLGPSTCRRWLSLTPASDSEDFRSSALASLPTCRWLQRWLGLCARLRCRRVGRYHDSASSALCTSQILRTFCLSGSLLKTSTAPRVSGATKTCPVKHKPAVETPGGTCSCHTWPRMYVGCCSFAAAAAWFAPCGAWRNQVTARTADMCSR